MGPNSESLQSPLMKVRARNAGHRKTLELTYFADLWELSEEHVGHLCSPRLPFDSPGPQELRRHEEANLQAGFCGVADAFQDGYQILGTGRMQNGLDIRSCLGSNVSKKGSALRSTSVQGMKN